MNADNMFYSLGYDKIQDDDTIVIFQCKETILGDYFEWYIKFSKLSKIVFIYDKDGQNVAINMEVLKAINKKCEELGWNE